MKWPPCLSQKSLVLNFFDWNSNPVHYLKQMVLIKGTRYGAFTTRLLSFGIENFIISQI